MLNLVNEYQLGNVEIKDPVEKNESLKILLRSDALYFHFQDSPVFRYGISPNKLFDYLASGKPIIFATNAPNNPIKDCNSGLTIPPDDPKALAAAIIELQQMTQEKRNEMGRNGRIYAEKNHDISLLADKFEKVLIEARDNH